MRICSFLPGATEIVYSIGLGDSICGVSYECDHPAAARSLPNVVYSSLAGNEGSSAEIDEIIRQRLAEGKGIYEIDQNVFQTASPDLVLTQELCEE